MRDSALIVAVRAALLPRLAAYGFADVEVKQAYQPTQQGRAPGPGLYVHKVGDTRHGFPESSDKFDLDALVMRHRESAQMVTTLQFSAIANPDPAVVLAVTAGDILKAAASALQSDPVLATLRAAEVGVLRVREVRNMHVVNDEQQFEANPSFDVSFTHRDTFDDVVPIVDGLQIVINRV